MRDARSRLIGLADLRSQPVRAWVVLLLGSIPASSGIATEPSDLRNAQVERLGKTPDLTQTNPAAGFAGGGSQYCCPVVVANVFCMWSENGADGLLPPLEGRTPLARHVFCAKRLASELYMNTSLMNGTGVGGMIRGSQRYVDSHGKATLSVDYYGWRRGAPRESNRGDTPDAGWIRDTLEKPRSAVLLNVGWYKEPSKHEYHRFGGHWVLLAAYDPTSENRYFLVDPSPRAGMTKSVHQVSLSQMAHGRLSGSKQGLPTYAAGRLRLIGDLKTKPGADAAIVDAAVALTLAPNP